jgi:phosphatidylglycerophosphate synthase
MQEIVEVYFRTRKTRDLFTNVYFFRPLAAPVVFALRNTKVTPNQVTLLSFVLALAAVALMFWPGYWGLLTATIVFTGSYVLDCVDGMLARLKGLQSTAGHLFDFLMDEIKSFFLLGAVAIRLYLEHSEDLYLLVGVVGLVSLATGIAVTTFQRRPEITGGKQQEGAKALTESGSSPALATRLMGLGLGVAHLVVHYPSYLLLVGLVGRAELYLFPYVAINVAYAVRSLLWLAIRHGFR